MTYVLTERDFLGYNSLLRSIEETSPTVKELCAHTSALLLYFSKRIDDLEFRTPITRQYSEVAIELIEKGDASGPAVSQVFKHLVLRARELALRSAVPNVEILRAFDYVDRVYGRGGDDAPFYELFKYKIHLAFLREASDSVEEQRIAIEKLVADWNGTINESRKSVVDIQEQLEAQHKQYNFVGLSKAFSNLLKVKKGEAYTILGLLLINALAILLIPVYLIGNESTFLVSVAQAFSVFSSTAGDASYREISMRLLRGLPYLAVEIALIYFFRILLQNYYNVKSQVVQLELRNALCQFVENYVNFSKQHEEKTIIRFESLIFSDLERLTANVPAPIDLEQLVSLLKIRNN